ncbi:MBOAT, membrane-bound O-acyltransferase family-domain-containing protein [Cristinia sonorae]|uniref:O-acyltransferase n=1 Tax=Cristinia sonorae TaxID=1940300 RepID=A0A8K0XMF2_9AGAR|nr:MBOAT, membrane-bound O-acyltransferase family-domain-containing protein [Cristinia sonorae]
MITFTPRKSHFDIENDESRKNEFRGFFTLFWISMFLSAVSTYVRSIERTGMPLPFDFLSLFSQDALSLALSDFAVVLSTGLAVPFVKAIKNGWIRYYWVGVVIQHLWQTTLLLVVISWTFQRNWPWVQSGYLTLHTLVMIMKVHSYVATNGYLQWVDKQAQSTLKHLHSLAETSDGSYEAAIEVAKAHRKELDAASHASTTPQSMSSISIGTPTLADGVTATYISPSAALAIREQIHMATPSLPMKNSSSSNSPRAPPPPPLKIMDTASVRKPAGMHPLSDHPDEKIAGLAKEYSEMESELVSTGPEYVRWPENVTYKNFAVYQLIPTLVYELEYPRTDRIRPLYVFEKTVATFGTFALLYTVTESFILPLTPSPDQSFWRSLLDLSIPFMVAYLLLFYIIFECICNGFAELSYFADRQFYDDWWNSTSWDEFSRKWNKPVHTFLLRHVYASTISSYKLSRQSAMFVTFLLSAAVHELVMAIVTKKIRMYLFVMQLAQIPLIAVGRLPFIKRNKLMGNIVFWIGLYAGFPLLCVAYCAY